MKRLVSSVFVAAYALCFAACEPRPVSELSDEYKSKPGNNHPEQHAEHAAAHDAKDPHAKDPHAKAAAPHAAPAEGEKKHP